MKLENRRKTHLNYLIICNLLLLIIGIMIFYISPLTRIYVRSPVSYPTQQDGQVTNNNSEMFRGNKPLAELG